MSKSSEKGHVSFKRTSSYMKEIPKDTDNSLYKEEVKVLQFSEGKVPKMKLRASNKYKEKLASLRNKSPQRRKKIGKIQESTLLSTEMDLDDSISVSTDIGIENKSSQDSLQVESEMQKDEKDSSETTITVTEEENSEIAPEEKISDKLEAVNASLKAASYEVNVYNDEDLEKGVLYNNTKVEVHNNADLAQGDLINKAEVKSANLKSQDFSKGSPNEITPFNIKHIDPKNVQESETDKKKETTADVGKENAYINQNDFRMETSNLCNLQIRTIADKSFSLNCKYNFKPLSKQLDSDKIKQLLNIVERYPIGTDMKLSLYIAACANNVTTLYPYPHTIQNANEQLYLTVNEEIPSVNLMSHYLKFQKNKMLQSEVFPVVYWLIGSMGPRMVLLKSHEMRLVLRKVSSTEFDQEPSMIFKLMNSKFSQGEVKWQAVSQGAQTFFAFHNCNVEQSHTIIHYGLHQNLNKNGIHGSGIYLTNDLNICLQGCQAGYTWGKSRIGTQLRLALVVEVIKDPSNLCYSDIAEPFLKTSTTERGDSVKFYFVKKPELLRVRYMLVYILKQSKIIRTSFKIEKPGNKLLKFVQFTRTALSLIILLMGISTSVKATTKNTVYEYIKTYFQNIGNKIAF